MSIKREIVSGPHPILYPCLGTVRNSLTERKSYKLIDLTIGASGTRYEEWIGVPWREPLNG